MQQAEAPMVQTSGPDVRLQGVEMKEPKLPPPTQEDLLAESIDLGNKIRDLIVRTKRLPIQQGFKPFQDPTRSLALAQSHLQTGLLWLRKCITQDANF